MKGHQSIEHHLGIKCYHILTHILNPYTRSTDFDVIIYTSPHPFSLKYILETLFVDSSFPSKGIMRVICQRPPTYDRITIFNCLVTIIK